MAAVEAKVSQDTGMLVDDDVDGPDREQSGILVFAVVGQSGVQGLRLAHRDLAYRLLTRRHSLLQKFFKKVP